MKIILLGKPGAGKGTQAQKLVEEEKFKIISTGDIIRSEIKKGTEIGRQIQGYVSKGELVPDEFVVDLVISKLNEERILFDGFPRTLSQAKFLDQKLKIDKVIFLHVDDEIVIKRIMGRVTVSKGEKSYSFKSLEEANKFVKQNGGEIKQRKDDTLETIKKRLEVYQENTKPLIDYYKSSNKFESVDSNQSIQEVHDEIIKKINSKFYKRL
ncbi:MAG: adenylate kinase [Candidatus Woesearchaeota archaeon]